MRYGYTAGKMQHRILNAGPLHQLDGRLAEVGYALQPLKNYDRSRIKASALRIKEWDYYLVSSDQAALALTISDNGYMGLDSVSLLDFEHKAQWTDSRLIPFPLGKRNLPASSKAGNTRAAGKGYEINFVVSGSKRELYGQVSNFANTGKQLLFDLVLNNPRQDSMVIVTPFAHKPRHFYYNQKINCLPAQGRVIFGEQDFYFAPAAAFGVLDWGRGVWPYRNTWYWGSASGIVQGRSFGLNIGHGFGDTSAASENMLFYGGQAHKLGQVSFIMPKTKGRWDPMATWQVADDSGRLQLLFEPVLNRAARIQALLLSSIQDQVFGRFSGTAVLDSGQKVEIEGLAGFLEKVSNKW